MGVAMLRAADAVVRRAWNFGDTSNERRIGSKMWLPPRFGTS